ncbi:MAG: alpha/beta hydrolase [Opitutales bacterium]
MRRKLTGIALCISLLMSLTVAIAQPVERYSSKLGLTPSKQIEFLNPEEGQPLKLHVFMPEGYSEELKYPCVVLFFGGGWNGGTAEQFYGQCGYLASRGMVAISAEYRVKKRYGTPPQVAAEDAKEAIRYIREHSSELGIDPERIIAGGGSAGGHVAAAAAFCPKIDSNTASPISPVPNGLILYNAVYDNGPDGYGHGRVKKYWEDISPLHNIRPGLPPTLVLLGTNDRLIPVSTAEVFQEKMRAAGNECETYFFEGQGHGFMNISKGGREMFEATLVKTDAFLVKYGYLTGEDSVAEWTAKITRNLPRVK